MGERKIIVVMGGSFNPPTLAHYRLMREAIDALDADIGLFVPVSDAYLKRKMRHSHPPVILSPELRVKMLQSMCTDSRMRVCEKEIGTIEPRTIPTLISLQEEYPNADIFFVMGADKLKLLTHLTEKQDFLKIKAELASALGQLAIGIEHVGSTSVQGLSAKPIIDIDVVIKDDTLLEDVVSALGEIGYQHEGNLGIVGREAFKYDGKKHLMKHHLYVCPEDSPELRRHIAFRDYLRAHPEAVLDYSRIKEEGAKQYPDDMERYIEHKSPFIEKIYAEIGI